MIDPIPMKNYDPAVRLTPHFALGEFVRSGTAVMYDIDNTPALIHGVRLTHLCTNVLEPLRQRFGVIRISSGYRCPELNRQVKGVENSQHMYGEAADIHISDMEVGQKMYDYIRDNLEFDQLIFEHNMRNGCRWLHVSYRSDRGPNRKQAF